MKEIRTNYDRVRRVDHKHHVVSSRFWGVVLLGCLLSMDIVNAAGGELQCVGYITSLTTFESYEEPKPIPCGRKYGDTWGPAAHQFLSCCSDEGRYAVQTKKMGGFDTTYEPGIIQVNAKCQAYADALTATLCDPLQIRYIQPGMFSICKSSCDAVFDACGMPGENFPSTANYMDGTTLCQELWGGFGTTSCESNIDGFPCRGGLTTIDVRLSSCLAILEPSPNVIDHYSQYGTAPNTCKLGAVPSDKRPIAHGLYVFLIVGFCGVCCLTGSWRAWVTLRHSRCHNNGPDGGTIQSEASTFNCEDPSSNAVFGEPESQPIRWPTSPSSPTEDNNGITGLA